jgi:hypothetical protein
MKIAWIFPQNAQCGISFYSKKYISALSDNADIVCLDPMDFTTDKRLFIEAIESCDLCHIQYETSFFIAHKRNFYGALCKAIKLPIIVTLHEIYERFPDIFPREEITGNFIVKPVKKLLYDIRHPHATAFARHLSRQFYADKIVVHANFQKEILVKKGMRPSILEVLPVPIKPLDREAAIDLDSARDVELVATGFINPSYDYALLFKTLDLCDFRWKFTWIGAARRPQDQELLWTIRVEIAKRNWENRFVVTGRISDEKRDALIFGARVYCAFFKYKSSSESVAVAIGARLPILCSNLPLFREMASEFQVMRIVDDDPKGIAAAIKKTALDENVRTDCIAACENYSTRYGVAAMSEKMIALYKGLCAA